MQVRKSQNLGPGLPKCPGLISPQSALTSRKLNSKENLLISLSFGHDVRLGRRDRPLFKLLSLNVRLRVQEVFHHLVRDLQRPGFEAVTPIFGSTQKFCCCSFAWVHRFSAASLKTSDRAFKFRYLKT